MRSSTPGRWARRIGVPAAAMVAAALVGAPAFAATSTPSHSAPPSCVVIVPAGQSDASAKPGKPVDTCYICVIKAHPADGTAPSAGTTAVNVSGTRQSGVGTGEPVQCPICPPPGTVGTTGAGAGTAADSRPGKGKPGPQCTICVVITSGQPGGPATQTTPADAKPVPVEPVPIKCETVPVTK